MEEEDDCDVENDQDYEKQLIFANRNGYRFPVLVRREEDVWWGGYCFEETQKYVSTLKKNPYDDDENQKIRKKCLEHVKGILKMDDEAMNLFGKNDTCTSLHLVAGVSSLPAAGVLPLLDVFYEFGRPREYLRTGDKSSQLNSLQLAATHGNVEVLKIMLLRLKSRFVPRPDLFHAIVNAPMDSFPRTTAIDWATFLLDGSSVETLHLYGCKFCGWTTSNEHGAKNARTLFRSFLQRLDGLKKKSYDYSRVRNLCRDMFVWLIEKHDDVQWLQETTSMNPEKSGGRQNFFFVNVLLHDVCTTEELERMLRAKRNDETFWERVSEHAPIEKTSKRRRKRRRGRPLGSKNKKKKKS